MILDIGLAVRVVTAIRTHAVNQHGCPTWDPEGVRAMLAGSEGPPGAVLAAACLAAEDASLRKPSPAALRRHWPVNASADPPRQRQEAVCPIHREELLGECGKCAETAGPEVTPEQRDAYLEQIRAELAKKSFKHRPRTGRPVDLTSDVSAARTRIDTEEAS